jgi:hypothetical protein
MEDSSTPGWGHGAGLNATEDRKISPLPGIFCFCVLDSFSCSPFVLLPYLFLCRGCLGLLLCLYCRTHNTNIHAFGGIRIRNSSKRAAADPRLRPPWQLGSTIESRFLVSLACRLVCIPSELSQTVVKPRVCSVEGGTQAECFRE